MQEINNQEIEIAKFSMYNNQPVVKLSKLEAYLKIQFKTDLKS